MHVRSLQPTFVGYVKHETPWKTNSSEFKHRLRSPEKLLSASHQWNPKLCKSMYNLVQMVSLHLMSMSSSNVHPLRTHARSRNINVVNSTNTTMQIHNVLANSARNNVGTVVVLKLNLQTHNREITKHWTSIFSSISTLWTPVVELHPQIGVWNFAQFKFWASISDSESPHHGALPRSSSPLRHYQLQHRVLR